MTDPTPPRPVGAPDDLASAEGAALSEAIDEVDQPGSTQPEAEPGLIVSLAGAESEAAGAEEVGAEAEVEAEEPRAARVAAGGRTRGATRKEQRPTPAAVGPEPETLPYIDDPVSRWWVILIAVVFAAIFAYGIFLGHGGVLTPIPTPSPIPTATAAPSPIPSTSATPATSATPSTSASPTASPSPSAGGSPSPTSS